MSYTQKITPRFHQLDPAGIVFYAEIFRICSDIQEDFLQSLGIAWADWYQNPAYAAPIRHAEADYLMPLHGGKTYKVDVQILTIGERSFSLEYTFRQRKTIHCSAQIAYVFIEKSTRLSIQIPPEIRTLLIEVQRQSVSKEARAAPFPKASAE